MQQYFEYSAEVEQAMKEKKPILALESTLITHGLPFPQNIEVAKAVEQIARDKGVVPATIAIMKGKIKIGLSLDELNELVHDKNVAKASCRDLPFILSKGQSAGTTVASTLFCAEYAGIRVFATGGIGGVHRGDGQDVSADLIQLARTPIAVVCAGVKAILDLPRTLEFLETYSIPVIGYGTDTLPAFYTSSSIHKLQARVDDMEALARLVKIHWQLGLPSGLLIANPILAQDEIQAETIEPVIVAALKQAEEKQIIGKAITPFLLGEVANATKGKSLEANINLIKNNVRVGAELARAVNQ